MVDRFVQTGDANGTGSANGRNGVAPWVLVAGGFHYGGGMDKANAALMRYLVERGTPLHLVAHHVDAELAGRAGVTVHLAPRPAGSFLLGEGFLARYGRGVAKAVSAKHPGTRVVVNGGNCDWPDINWVHSVHHAWRLADDRAPAWFRVKNRVTGRLARQRERCAIHAARFVLANSERTRRDLIEHFDLHHERVHTVYLGADDTSARATPGERVAARAWLNVPDARPLVAFVGALGHDMNKGFDTLWTAWKNLCARSSWDADLIVAGGGRGVAVWRQRIADAGLANRVRLLGFTDRVGDVLAAVDLLVSPARYEAYGLNVQEAVCRGVPALVSSRAGIAERYPPDLAEMILPDPEDAADLANRLLSWRAGVECWRQRFSPLADMLRRHTWTDMAREIVDKTS